MQCPRCNGAGDIPDSPVVALCQIEHEGIDYDYGDPVPDSVVAAHPTAVGAKPLSEEDIANMSPAEMAEHLRILVGLKQPPVVGILHRMTVEGVAGVVGETAGDRAS